MCPYLNSAWMFENCNKSNMIWTVHEVVLTEKWHGSFLLCSYIPGCGFSLKGHWPLAYLSFLKTALVTSLLTMTLLQMRLKWRKTKKERKKPCSSMQFPLRWIPICVKMEQGTITPGLNTRFFQMAPWRFPPEDRLVGVPHGSCGCWHSSNGASKWQVPLPQFPALAPTFSQTFYIFF